MTTSFKSSLLVDSTDKMDEEEKIDEEEKVHEEEKMHEEEVSRRPPPKRSKGKRPGRPRVPWSQLKSKRSMRKRTKINSDRLVDQGEALHLIRYAGPCFVVISIDPNPAFPTFPQSSTSFSCPFFSLLLNFSPD